MIGAPASGQRITAIGEWSGRRVSNPRHSAWKADALPTELLPPGAATAPPLTRAERYHVAGGTSESGHEAADRPGRSGPLSLWRRTRAGDTHPRECRSRGRSVPPIQEPEHDDDPQPVGSGKLGDWRRSSVATATDSRSAAASDTQRVLPTGSPADVRAEVGRAIATLGPGGGYLLAAVHTIMNEVPPENVLAMVDAAVELGTYPSAADPTRRPLPAPQPTAGPRQRTIETGVRPARKRWANAAAVANVSPRRTGHEPASPTSVPSPATTMSMANRPSSTASSSCDVQPGDVEERQDVVLDEAGLPGLAPAERTTRGSWRARANVASRSAAS